MRGCNAVIIAIDTYNRLYEWDCVICHLMCVMCSYKGLICVIEALGAAYCCYIVAYSRPV